MIAPTRKNILIVEDDQFVAMEMAKSLERLGYDVMAVLASGEEVLERSAKLPHPDLVIMDISLAGSMDGIQAGKYVEHHLKIPVIYITGYREKAAMLEERGKVPLIKPFTTEDLRAAIGVVFYQISLRNTPREISNPQKEYTDLN